MSLFHLFFVLSLFYAIAVECTYINDTNFVSLLPSNGDDDRFPVMAAALRLLADVTTSIGDSDAPLVKSLIGLHKGDNADAIAFLLEEHQKSTSMCIQSRFKQLVRQLDHDLPDRPKLSDEEFKGIKKVIKFIDTYWILAEGSTHDHVILFVDSQSDIPDNIPINGQSYRISHAAGVLNSPMSQHYNTFVIKYNWDTMTFVQQRVHDFARKPMRPGSRNIKDVLSGPCIVVYQPEPDVPTCLPFKMPKLLPSIPVRQSFPLYLMHVMFEDIDSVVDQENVTVLEVLKRMKNGEVVNEDLLERLDKEFYGVDNVLQAMIKSLPKSYIHEQVSCFSVSKRWSCRFCGRQAKKDEQSTSFLTINRPISSPKLTRAALHSIKSDVLYECERCHGCTTHESLTSTTPKLAKYLIVQVDDDDQVLGEKLGGITVGDTRYDAPMLMVTDEEVWIGFGKLMSKLMWIKLTRNSMELVHQSDSSPPYRAPKTLVYRRCD